MQLEPVAVFRDQRPHRGRHLLQQGRQGERLDVQFHLPRFDLRQVKHVVDQRQQMLPGCVDLLEIGHRFPVAALGRVFLQHLAVADDRIERGAQLMAHARQELALRAVRGFGLAPSGEQLRDVVIQRHQAHAATVHDHGHPQHLDLHQAAVLAAPLADHLHRPARQRLLGITHRLGARRLGGDQVVQVLADHLGLAVAVHLLERRVAGDDPVVHVERHDRHRAVEHQLGEVLPLLLGGGEQPRVGDRDGGLRGEQVEQPEVVLAEAPLRIAVHERDRAHQFAAHHERGHHDRVEIHRGVLRRPSGPFEVVGDEQRLARPRDVSHRTFAHGHARPDRVALPHVMTGDDIELLGGRVVDRELPVAHAQ